jgi:hypothetical protein
VITGSIGAPSMASEQKSPPFFDFSGESNRMRSGGQGWLVG